MGKIQNICGVGYILQRVTHLPKSCAPFPLTAHQDYTFHKKNLCCPLTVSGIRSVKGSRKHERVSRHPFMAQPNQSSRLTQSCTTLTSVHSSYLPLPRRRPYTTQLTELSLKYHLSPSPLDCVSLLSHLYPTMDGPILNDAFQPKPLLKMATVSGNNPGSQLAWLSSLKTGFNDFTPDQKFLRKVCQRLPQP